MFSNKYNGLKFCLCFTHKILYTLCSINKCTNCILYLLCNPSLSLIFVQGQCDLLRSAKIDALDTLRQLALACEASGLIVTSDGQYTSHGLSSRRGSSHGNGRIWAQETCREMERAFIHRWMNGWMMSREMYRCLSRRDGNMDSSPFIEAGACF